MIQCDKIAPLMFAAMQFRSKRCEYSCQQFVDRKNDNELVLKIIIKMFAHTLAEWMMVINSADDDIYLQISGLLAFNSTRLAFVVIRLQPLRAYVFTWKFAADKKSIGILRERSWEYRHTAECDGGMVMNQVHNICRQLETISIILDKRISRQSILFLYFPRPQPISFIFVGCMPRAA